MTWDNFVVHYVNKPLGYDGREECRRAGTDLEGAELLDPKQK